MCELMRLSSLIRSMLNQANRAVTPMPEIAEVKRRLMLRDSTWRKLAPNTGRMPVRTQCVPQTPRILDARSHQCRVLQKPMRHGYLALLTRNNSSKIRQTAPTVMALSATLKAGKCQPA